MVFTQYLRASLLAVSLLVSPFIQAKSVNWQEQCGTIPQDNIFINSKQVEIYGKDGALVITPNGEVTRNDVPLNLSAETKAKAKLYQESLRRDLPYVYEGAKAQAESFYQTLDKLLVDANNGRGRAQLKTMKQQLDQQIAKIVVTKSDGMAFHVDKAKEVEQESQRIVEQGLGAIVQESVNGLTLKELKDLSRVNNLQTALRKTWLQQYQKSRNFVDDACAKARQIEQQRSALIRDLPKS